VADAYVLAVVHLRRVSGLPADEVINTFAFQTVDGPLDDGIAESIWDQLHDFYGGFGAHLATTLSRATGDSYIQYFDVTGHLNGSPGMIPRPDLTRNLGLPDAVGYNSLPAELAVALSYQGVGNWAEGPAGGPRPASRHRGRIFLGPWDVGSMEENAVSEVHVAAGVRASILVAAQSLALSDDSINWSVWSRANAVMYPIYKGWCDNAFDVQRRRGNKSTIRGVFSAV
jgi:hypothetical protein